MRTERRLHQRIVSQLQANFYIESDNNDPNEFGGIIENLSENGIKIVVSDQDDFKVVNEIVVGDEVVFQAVDEYELYGKTRMDIFKGHASVVRIEKDENDIVLGCEVNSISKDFEKYVSNKRISLYLSTMRRQH